MSPTPLRTFLITAAGCSLFSGLYAGLGIAPTPVIALMILFAPLVAAMIWLHTDARARHIELVYDMGLFIWLAWPIVIPWYVLRTRSAHGVPLALVMVFGILLPLLVAVMIEAVRYVGQS